MHPLPALPNFQVGRGRSAVISGFIWEIRALSVGIKLVAINLRLLLLLFNVKIIDFHCVCSFDVAWLSNTHNEFHWWKDCAIRGWQESSMVYFCVTFYVLKRVAYTEMH